MSLLKYVPKSFAEYTMNKMEYYSAGQNYTDVVLNIYKTKQKKSILSSFDDYNSNLQCYQQVLWMANVEGIGVWSKSVPKPNNAVAYVSKRLGDEICDVNPTVVQNGNILLAVYTRY
jgi:hypothetical protein